LTEMDGLFFSTNATPVVAITVAQSRDRSARLSNVDWPFMSNSRRAAAPL
jgi:hypothetical protein